MGIDIAELIADLDQRFQAEKVCPQSENCLEYIVMRDDVDEAATQSLLDCTLITPKGNPAYGVHDQLKTQSDGRYRVSPGETDSFGWLTGVLHTPVGKYVFG